MDFSSATVEELSAELDGVQEAMKAIRSGAGPGRPFDGRDERLLVELQQKEAAIKAELAKRNAPRT